MEFVHPLLEVRVRLVARHVDTADRTAVNFCQPLRVCRAIRRQVGLNDGLLERRQRVDGLEHVLPARVVGAKELVRVIILAARVGRIEIVLVLAVLRAELYLSTDNALCCPLCNADAPGIETAFALVVPVGKPPDVVNRPVKSDETIIQA